MVLIRILYCTKLCYEPPQPRAYCMKITASGESMLLEPALQRGRAHRFCYRATDQAAFDGRAIRPIRGVGSLSRIFRISHSSSTFCRVERHRSKVRSSTQTPGSPGIASKYAPFSKSLYRARFIASWM